MWAGPVRICKSAKHANKARKAFKNGTFIVNDKKIVSWQQKILEFDPHAEFSANELLQVQHSCCGKQVRVNEPYDVTKFHKHEKDCKGNSKSASMSTLYTFFGKVPGQPKIKGPVRQAFLCPGITTTNEPKLDGYLKHTGSGGGGSESVTAIAGKLFNEAYGKLKTVDKDTVKDQQTRNCTWHNDHAHYRVFASTCMVTVTAEAQSDVKMCAVCTNVHRSKVFKNALRV